MIIRLIMVIKLIHFRFGAGLYASGAYLAVDKAVGQ
jgi:hypothetical protein